MVKRYDSLSAFRADAEQAIACDSRRSADYADSWLGGESPRGALNTLLFGNDATTAQAEELLSQIALPEISTRRAVTVRSPYGGRVSVSDWLAGSPTPMRRRRKTDLDTNPLQVYVSTTCSAAITADQIMRRGVAILAYLMLAQQYRPVDLCLYTDMHGDDDGTTHLLIPIESRPLNLSTSAYCLTSAGYDRGLTHSVGRMLNGFDGSWAAGFQYGRANAAYTAGLRRKFNASDDALMISSIHAHDPLLTDPLGWINDQLSHAGLLTD